MGTEKSDNARILHQLQPFRLLTDEDDEIAGMPIEEFYRDGRLPILAPDEEAQKSSPLIS